MKGAPDWLYVVMMLAGPVLFLIDEISKRI